MAAFALVADLHLMTPLVSVFISYTFLSLESLAEELEDPFGTAPNHLPLDALCVNIERNLKAMNNDFPLPAASQPGIKGGNFEAEPLLLIKGGRLRKLLLTRQFHLYQAALKLLGLQALTLPARLRG